MKSRLTLTPWMKATLRLLVTASLVLLAVHVVISATQEPRLVPSVQEGSTGMTDSSRPVPPSDDVGDFYLYQGQRVSLHRSRDALGVRFRPTLHGESVATTLRALAPDASLQHSGDPGTQGVSIVLLPLTTAGDQADRSKTGSPQRQLDLARNALNESATVEFAFPVFINPVTGIRILVTDEIVARLHAGTAASTLAERFALTVVGPLWKTADEYVFRLADPKSTDPFTVANAMTESGLVDWAEPNFIQEYQKPATPNDPLFPSQWHLNNTGQGGGTPGADAHLPGAWDMTTGSPSIVIAIIDDGVERTHEDLAANIFTNAGEIPGNGVDDDGNGYIDDVNGWDFSNNDNDPSPMSTSDNHGTAVAGVAAGRGDNGVGVSGACQTCSILPVKIFSPSFAGDTAAADAIRYAASLADVLNNSWGGGTPSSTIQSAIQWATTYGRGGKGSVVLFASGNSAGAFYTFTLTGFPAGTHHFRWSYIKDISDASGEDTAWLAWVELPGGERIDFESGMPGDWTTGGSANWSVVSDRNRADEGLCQTHSAKAGTIGNSQASYLGVVRTVPAGSLRYRAWVSSEAGYDILRVYIDLYNDNLSWMSFFPLSGVPTIITDVSYPAAYPESIAVGAVSDFGCRSAYSQYGPALAFVAPSNGGNSDITTTDRTGTAGYDTTSNYTSTFGGTSSATPLSSGIAALVLSRDPSLTVAQVRQVLEDTADKVGLDPYVSGRNDRYGYGRINAGAAVAAVGLPSAFGKTSPGNGVTDQATSLSLVWESTTGATSYEYCYDTTNDSACDGSWTSTGSSASAEISGLANATTFYWQVRARNTAGVTEADSGTWWTFTTAPPTCTTFSIDPTSANPSYVAGSTDVTITGSPAGCTGGSWTASGNGSWISVTTTSGSGSSSVTVSWAQNTSASPRSDHATIADNSFTVNQGGAAAITSLTADRTFPSPEGTPITWTATVTGGVAPIQYQFWRLDPGGWTIVQPYSTTTTYTWTSPSAGTYQVAVWVKSAGSAAAFEAVLGTPSFAIGAPLTIQSLTTPTTFPAPAGTPITWTAATAGGVAPIQYQFWRYSSGTGWVVVQPYSTTATYTWTSPTLGTYQIAVWVRSAGSSASLEAVLGTPNFVIGAPITIQSLTTPTTFPSPAGTPITWTATVTGGVAPIQYQFWRYSSGTGWVIVQPYSTTATYTWTSPTLGTYQVAVWVKSAGSSASLDAVLGTPNFAIGAPLTIQSLTTPTTFPSPAGTPITWTAATTGGVAPIQYQFWRYSSGTGWVVVQPYSTTATYTWTSPTAGTYQVAVWVRSAGYAGSLEAALGTPYFVIQ